MAIRIGLLFCVFSWGFLGGPQNSGESPSADADPREILKKAAEAAKPIRTVRFQFRRQATGANENREQTLEGTSLFGGWAHNTIKQFHVRVTARKPGSAEPTEITAGSDGDLVFLIDHAQKKVHADIDPAVLGSRTRVVRSAMISDFVDPNGFADEINAEKLVLKGNVTVGGEECYEIVAPGQGRQAEVVWFIAKRDYLPRRLDFNFTNREGQPAGVRIELSNLEVNPPLDSEPFKLVVPEGYTRTDDFAP